MDTTVETASSSREGKGVGIEVAGGGHVQSFSAMPSKAIPNTVN